MVRRLFRQHKKLFSDYFAVIGGNGLGRGLSLLTTLILARALQVHDFGIFSVFFTVMMLVWLIPSSLDTSYVRFYKINPLKTAYDYLRTVFVLKITITVILVLCAFPLGKILANYVFRKSDLYALLSFAIISGVLLSLYSTFAAIYQAQERFYRFSTLNVIFYALPLSLVVGSLALKIELTPVKVMWIFFASALLIGLAAVLFLCSVTKPPFSVRKEKMLEIFHFGKWLFAENGIYIILQRVDILVLTRLVAYEELGIYSAAVRIAMLAVFLTSAASAIFMPRGCASLQSQKHLKRYFKESLVGVSGLSFILALLFIFTPLLVKVLFGQEFISAVLASRILLIEAWFVLLYTPFSYLFYASGQTKKIFAIGVIKLFLAAVSLFIFVPKLGSSGAALSMAIASFGSLVCVIVFSINLLKKNENISYYPG